MFIIPAAFTFADFHRRRGWHAPWPWLESTLASLTDSTAVLLTMGGAALAASAVVVVTSAAKFGGSVLDLVLDVDNYLRTTPAESPPRARIAERYVSLLRYLASDAPEGGAYDAVVIIAHSLGALITADLLRFLKTEQADPALARLGFGGDHAPDAHPKTRPLHLFTMGAPIRQLINRFFPHRYRWVRDTPDNGVGPVPVRRDVHRRRRTHALLGQLGAGHRGASGRAHRDGVIVIAPPGACDVDFDRARSTHW